MNDMVVPKKPHGWRDICCRVVRTRNETMCLVGNGRGQERWLHESHLEYVCDFVHRYTLHKVMTDPEFAKKTIFIVHKEQSPETATGKSIAVGSSGSSSVGSRRRVNSVLKFKNTEGKKP